MNKKISNFHIFILFLSLTIGVFVLAPNIFAEGDCSHATILCVDDTAGPTQEYPTIQEAIDNATAGDTVLVYPGTYKETITTKTSGTVSDRITIKAVNRATETSDSSQWTTIDGENIRRRAVIIDKKYYTIEGFRFLDHKFTNSSIENGVIDAWGNPNVGDGLNVKHNVFEHTYSVVDGDNTNYGAEIATRQNDYVYIGYNKFQGIKKAEEPAAYAPQLAASVYYAKDYIIEYNDIGGYVAFSGLKLYQSQGTSWIRYNYFHNSPDNTETNVGPIYFRNTEINETVNFHNNLFRDNAGIHFYNQQTTWFEKNHRIYNNTFIGGTACVKIAMGTSLPTRPDPVWGQSQWTSYYDNIFSGCANAYSNTGQGGDTYYTTSRNVYYGITTMGYGNYTVATNETTASQNPLDSNYLSLPPYQDRGANLDVSVWPFKVVVNSDVCSPSNILCVGSGKEYSTIQSAVDNATAGDTVLVHPGTYYEGVEINKSGTATAPITIKALYPARKPLDGSTYADIAEKRSVIDASGKLAGFYNDNPNSNTGSDTTRQVSYIIIDGFYIQNGTNAGILFNNDRNLWIRNNMAVNNGYSISENYGNYNLDSLTSDSLLQNNYAEFSLDVNSANTINIDGANNIVEYNEVYVNGKNSSGRAFYVHSKSENLIFRYNYEHFDSQLETALGRFRDSVNFTVTNNYVMSKENTNFWPMNGKPSKNEIENYKINNNTLAFEKGVYSDYGMMGLGDIEQAEVKNNIFYSGINDASSYAIGSSWSQKANPNSTANNNIYYNLVGLIDPRDPYIVTGFTETNTQNINPNINLDTGCSTTLDNNIYGANLDVSQIPYRKCDGTFYPAEGKFGIAVNVSGGASPPPLPPPPPPLPPPPPPSSSIPPPAPNSTGGGGGSGLIVFDATPPLNPSILINNGAEITATTTVNLSLSVIDATQMLISNYSDFSGATWETYATSKIWNLTSGNGTKAVYIKFRDASGNYSNTVAATIIARESAPLLETKEIATSSITSNIASSIIPAETTKKKVVKKQTAKKAIVVKKPSASISAQVPRVALPGSTKSRPTRVAYSQPKAEIQNIIILPTKSFTKRLVLGTEGEEVKRLQQFLARDKEIYPQGVINGRFDAATRKAVQRFQEKYEIFERGDIGYGDINQATRVKINQLLAVVR